MPRSYPGFSDLLNNLHAQMLRAFQIPPSRLYEDREIDEPAPPDINSISPNIARYYNPNVPDDSRPIVCQGCRNYYGLNFRTRFVCAMHPYGVEEEACPDWESS